MTYGSYLNRHSQESNGCIPQGYNADHLLPLYDGVKTAGACNNDIVVSRSTTGGWRSPSTTAETAATS